MNESLKEIDGLIKKFHQLKLKKWKMGKEEYKCKHWENYDNEYEELISDLENTRVLIMEKCNEFVDYPSQKFLFFDLTDKVSVGKSMVYDEIVINVPFVDKREYYCLIDFLNNCEELYYPLGSNGVYIMK